MLTILNVCPVGKPRMTQRDKWMKRECTNKYWTFCDTLRWEVKAKKLELTKSLRIIFYLPIPKSYKKRKEYENKPHDKKPDWDNLAKAFCDALYPEDSVIYHADVTKYYSLTPRIEVEFLNI